MGDEDIKEKVYQNYVEMISNIEEFDNSEFKTSSINKNLVKLSESSNFSVETKNTEKEFQFGKEEEELDAT